MYAYKLLNPDLTSYGRCQWTVGEWKETSGEGALCGRGWLHAYPSPTIAHFLNPIHANLTNPVCYRVEVEGDRRDDHGLKVGYTRMRLLAPMALPIPTTEQRVRFAIGCAAAITRAPSFFAWADAWLCGAERSAAAVRSAARSAAWSAAWSAETAAARSAAWSAETAAARAAGSLDLEAMAVWAMSNSVRRLIQKEA